MRRMLALAMLLLGAGTVRAESVCPEGKSLSPLVYSTWHRPKHRPYTDQNDHPLVQAALITTRWRVLEPRRGTFDWSTLDEAIAGWTGSADRSADTSKKAVLGLIPFSIWWPYPGDPNPNGDTPPWLYDAGVPRVSFGGGDEVAGARVVFPKVWDERFYAPYGEFLSEVGKRYGSDRRVWAIQVGIGFLGTTEMYWGKEANGALKKAGWTLPAWEAHVRRTIDLSADRMPGKPLFLRFTERFKNGVFTVDNLDTARRIVDHALSRGVSVSLGDLDPDWEPHWYGWYLLRGLADREPPPGGFLGIEDDCPFYAPKDPRCRSGTGKLRDLGETERFLGLVPEATAGLGARWPVVFFFQRPETASTNRRSGEFKPEVYEAVRKVLCR